MSRKMAWIDPTILSQMPPVALKALRDVEGLLAGLHQSPHRGQSIEFTEHKEYAPGDDLRHLDWRLLAKSDRYYIKQFEDETNLRAYLLLDASASMNYPHHPDALAQRPTKYRYAGTLALSLAYILLRQRDAIGLMSFNDAIQHQLPPRSHPSYLLSLAHAIEQQAPQGQTALPLMLQRLGEIARRRSVIFILSDLFTETEALAAKLKQLRHRGHDIVLFHLLDTDEIDFPFRDQTLFEDVEEATRRLQIDAHSIRPYYLDELKRFLQHVEQIAKQSGIAYRQISTATPLVDVLRQFLLQRARMRKRAT